MGQAGKGITPNSSTLNLKAELSGEGAVGRGLLSTHPSPHLQGAEGLHKPGRVCGLPVPVTVRPQTSAEWGRGAGPVRRHSRLQSAAPPPPEGPPFGHYSCLEMASPNLLGRLGKMLKRRLKTRERREVAVAAKKPAPPQSLPCRSAGTAKSELAAEPTPSFNRSRPKPRNPASSHSKSRPGFLRLSAQFREDGSFFGATNQTSVNSL